jgi:hypothetical protein
MRERSVQDLYRISRPICLRAIVSFTASFWPVRPSQSTIAVDTSANYSWLVRHIQVRLGFVEVCLVAHALLSPTEQDDESAERASVGFVQNKWTSGSRTLRLQSDAVDTLIVRKSILALLYCVVIMEAGPLIRNPRLTAYVSVNP